jgi:hypothetical protein
MAKYIFEEYIKKVRPNAEISHCILLFIFYNYIRDFLHFKVIFDRHYVCLPMYLKRTISISRNYSSARIY